MSRSIECEIAGNKFELIYTIAVTMQIGQKYGSMQKFIDKIAQAAEAEDTSSVFDDLLYVFTLMANQSILRDNHFNGANKSLWDKETIEILFTPADMITARDHMFEAINVGNGRAVQGEGDEDPNADAGQ